jgi:glucose dehydrogenase
MSQRYSPLTQVTTDNAKNLQLKWVYQTNSTEKTESTPLVVDGIMYTIKNTNDVVALNATTGAVLWNYSHTYDPTTRNPS